MREKIESIKHIIILYYLVIGVIFLLFTYFVPMDTSMDRTITVILCLYLLVFPVVLLFTLRYALHVFLFSLAFISGFYGFYHHSVDNHSISNALYFTFRLYLLDLADVFTQDGSSPIRYPLLLEIARWTAASYTITTIFIAMYRTLEREISLFIAQTIGKHHIIFSYNEKSHYLIQDLCANNERVIVVDEKFTPEIQNMLEAMKVIVIQSPINDENIFRVCGAKKAQSISLFHPKDQDSLYTLMNLEKFSRNKKIKLTFKRLIIHIEDNHYKIELLSFLEKVEHFSFPVEVINVYEEVARRFWNCHQSIFEEQNDIHMLVVGYNAFGKQIVSEAEEAHHQSRTNQKITMAILDEFPEYKQLNNIEKIPFNIEKDSVKTVIEEQQQVFTHIFICLDEDYIDLMEGIELSEIFSTTPIYMNFTDETIEQTFMIATTKTKKSLYSTGTNQDVLTKNYLNL
ncbi:hypothetical protein KQI49_09575 [Virgibacillus sp. MSJ-26]|uniref:hypothetical protein n=1 Tax=Virgibacillus sp. MSJ-26 TaxID=2841522 RepID=UPI001C11F45E|nr:hypothetical protein [Virgibacillus sp. MSJ-26]MBU5467070.1 hypothetical protein [Virgibacillus sp. MSJ-26]